MNVWKHLIIIQAACIVTNVLVQSFFLNVCYEENCHFPNMQLHLQTYSQNFEND